MTRNPACCLATDTAVTAAEMMKAEDVGSIPVVEDRQSNKLTGILTDRDIVLKIVASGKDVNSATIDEAMTSNPVTCRPDDHLETAMDRMAQHQIRRIPIVDGKNCIVGIISQADVATRVDMPAQTAEVLEDISQSK
ncbi:MAG: CBS domain-containing protein [Opitutaceae bacterium]|nr:CBS domain-containing protein [Verrucomicrobiales bacterium]